MESPFPAPDLAICQGAANPTVSYLTFSVPVRYDGHLLRLRCRQPSECWSEWDENGGIRGPNKQTRANGRYATMDRVLALYDQK